MEKWDQLKCNYCGAENILQQISKMISPTDSEVFKTMGPNSFDWEDYFWCEECEDECWPFEDDEEIKSVRDEDSIQPLGKPNSDP